MKSFLNVNVYPLICELAKIKCHENNGSINIFKDYIFATDLDSFSISIHSNFIFLNYFITFFYTMVYVLIDL
jgi:hypothetical protein